MQTYRLYNSQHKGKPYISPQIHIITEDNYNSLLGVSGGGQDTKTDPKTGGEGDNPGFSKKSYMFDDDDDEDYDY